MPALAFAHEADTVRAILADPRYQTALPDGAGFLDLKLPRGWLPSIPIPPAVWVSAALVLVAVLVWRLWPREREQDAPRREPAAPFFAAGSLDEARRLAAEGRHVEAVHALLLLALAEWRPAAESGGRELTSREVLRALPAEVPTRERDALWQLIRTVEWSWFGGRPLGAAEYEQALECCRVIVERPR